MDTLQPKPRDHDVWIRQPKPRDVVHDVCVFVCECVLGNPKAFQPEHKLCSEAPVLCVQSQSTSCGTQCTGKIYCST